MPEQQWRILSEIEAGGVWAAVAEHPCIEQLDRTHCADRTTLGLWMSPQPNASRGRFLTSGWHRGDAPLGSVVAIPGGMPLRVQSDAMPARRMLHCRLPARAPLQAASIMLDDCVDFRNDVVVSSLLRLARETSAPGFGREAIVEGLGLIIAGELERSFAGKQPRLRKGGLAPWQLQRIDDYIQSGNWNSSISDLARLCGISPGHAMRAFRQSTGRSIAGHVAALRIDHACKLLAEDDLSIAQVAAELQFADSSGFAAAFRRSLGMSPNLYRHWRRGKA